MLTSTNIEYAAGLEEAGRDMATMGWEHRYKTIAKQAGHEGARDGMGG